jgi:AcrR family transcriptional regulator
MVTMTFQRARSEEQRAARRQAILGTAATMLAEMPVAQLSLNELSRRVGLAKSNVLRYFESREAVLLELLADGWSHFTADLARSVSQVDPALDLAARGTRLATAVTETLIAHPLLCELMSESASVLERNISTEVARAYKSAALTNLLELSALTTRCVPELSAEGGMNFATTAAVCASGLWPLAHPNEAVLPIYEDPAFAPMRLEFHTGLTDMLETVLAGCLARWPATS